VVTAVQPTVEVVTTGTDWPAIVAAIVTGLAAIIGIAGTAWQAARGRRAAAADLKTSIDAAAKNLRLSITTEDRRAHVAEKRRVYTEFLRSISVSFAKAKAEGQAKSGPEDTPEAKLRHNHEPKTEFRQFDTPEDADLLAATAAIELLANEEISETARELSDDIIDVHKGLRDGNLSPNGSEVRGINERRLDLVDQFKEDLGIPTGDVLRASNPHQPFNPSSAAQL
jgi:hypothetical protein